MFVCKVFVLCVAVFWAFSQVESQPGFTYPYHIEVENSSQLYVPLGSKGRIVVKLKNYGDPGAFFISGVTDDENSSIAFFPLGGELMTEEGTSIGGWIRVPPHTNKTFLTLTVFVKGSFDNVLSQRKLLVQLKPKSGEKSAPTFTVKPTAACDQRFLDEGVCAEHAWIMRSEIQDSESGLFSVATQPEIRFFGDNFPVGTTDPVIIEQVLSCCNLSVDVTAVDMNGNKIIRRTNRDDIYLTTGDIISIALGVMILAVGIIIVFTVVVYRCVERKLSVSTAAAYELGGQENNTTSDATTCNTNTL